jgi:glycosyltransferase involved in cell wall biosynthesis
MRVAILMPAYCEGSRLTATLGDLRARAAELGDITVFLVDDGSEPPIADFDLPAASACWRVVLARHVVNLGQGAALETARQLALGAATFDAYVTFDSDGQHRAADVEALVHAVARGADVVLGNRFAGASNPPLSRRALLAAARIFEALAVGASASDAHNGLRAFSARAIARARLRQSRMAHATELAGFAARARRQGLVVEEAPVSIRYTRDSLDKGQGALGALTIVRDLFHRYLFEEP